MDDAFDREWMLDAETVRWRTVAARFAQEVVAPLARDLDRQGRFDPQLVRALGAADLIRAGLPASEGGGGASVLATCAIAEELGAVDGSLRGFLAVQGGLVLSCLTQQGTAAQKDRWVEPLLAGEAIGAFCLTEPGAGSDVGAIETTVTPDGDDVILQGEKIWITNGGVADVLLVFGSMDRSAGVKGLVCHLVPADTPGITAEPMPGQELGHRASDHARLVFRDVRVPAASRLGPERGGFAVAMQGLQAGRLHVAAGAVGAHRACLEASVAFARSRRQFGKRVGDFQQIGAALADMETRLRASRALVHHAARLADAGSPSPSAVAAAKLHATEAAVQAATQAVQLHGARGYTDELPMERHLRDMIALTIYEGTSHVQRVILARALLGKDTSA